MDGGTGSCPQGSSCPQRHSSCCCTTLGVVLLTYGPSRLAWHARLGCCAAGFFTTLACMVLSAWTRHAWHCRCQACWFAVGYLAGVVQSLSVLGAVVWQGWWLVLPVLCHLAMCSLVPSPCVTVFYTKPLRVGSWHVSVGGTVFASARVGSGGCVVGSRCCYLCRGLLALWARRGRRQCLMCGEPFLRYNSVRSGEGVRVPCT